MEKKEYCETKTIVSPDGKTTVTTVVKSCTISDTQTTTHTSTVTTKTITLPDGTTTTEVTKE